MRLRNRLFPYPVLNNNKKLSDYNADSVFELCFDNETGIKVDKDLVLKNVCFRSNDNYLTSLLKKGSLKGVLIIECSNSIFREKYEIAYEPRTITIPIDKFSGNIDISAFVYATEDINDYSSSSFLNDYIGSVFEVEKYCIVAADDGFSVKVENQPENESRKKSIFTVTCDHDNDDDLIRYVMNARKIVIYLSEKNYQHYNAIKHNELFFNVSFATLAIPVLTECIMNLQNEFKRNAESTLEDVCLVYPWFRSVCNAYEREKGGILTNEQFREDVKPVELAQIVFGNASCNGISDLFGVVTGASNEKEDEDE